MSDEPGDKQGDAADTEESEAKLIVSETTSTGNVDIQSLHPALVESKSKAYKGLFTKLRDQTTTPSEFVAYAKRAMRLLAEDALAEFPSESVSIQTPCGPFDGVKCPDASDLCAVSIVRSGDALLESVRECLPHVSVGKILIQRDEMHPDKIPKLYYSKLPPGVQNKYVLLCDPMLATGGSAIMALGVLVEKYNISPDRIIFANMICAPEGIKALASAYPEVKIVTACIDSHLNEHKFIVPGLGDYGDRFFNTA